MRKSLTPAQIAYALKRKAMGVGPSRIFHDLQKDYGYTGSQSALEKMLRGETYKDPKVGK